MESELDRLIVRLRELRLATPSALVAGASEQTRGAILDAFADDVASALRDAEAKAKALVSILADGRGPWAFAAAGAKARAGAAEHRDKWRASFVRGADAASELARLLTAAAPLVDVLMAAEGAGGRATR